MESVTLTVIGLLLPEDDAASLQSAQSLFAGTNPWRDIPADQEAALKEVLFIAETLRDIFLPTSLPDEDDYEFLSKLVKNLETRRDISWTTLYETGVDTTVSAIANRREEEAAPEPFGLTERFRKLHDHWYELKMRDGNPDRWEVEHDTTFLPPLLKARGLDGEWTVEGRESLTSILSAEQKGRMEERYAEWKASSDRKVKYLKDHPPTPMGWYPVPKSNTGIRAAWDEIREGKVVQAGMTVAEKLLVKSPKWKPMYRSLITERIPMSVYEGMTAEEDEQSKRWTESNERYWALGEERRKKQEELQERLEAEKNAGQAVKDEL